MKERNSSGKLYFHVPTINTILKVGNCCVKKFIDQSSRTCFHCSAPHKNKLLSYCNDCKEYVKHGYTEKCLSCNSLSK